MTLTVIPSKPEQRGGARWKPAKTAREIEAIKSETQMKVWKRNWKIEVIEQLNPDWLDLHEHIEYELSSE